MLHFAAYQKDHSEIHDKTEAVKLLCLSFSAEDFGVSCVLHCIVGISVSVLGNSESPLNTPGDV